MVHRRILKGDRLRNMEMAGLANAASVVDFLGCVNVLAPVSSVWLKDKLLNSIFADGSVKVS